LFRLSTVPHIASALPTALLDSAGQVVSSDAMVALQQASGELRLFVLDLRF